MIVVTGGLGFIGNELVRQLKATGEPIAIIDNRNRVAPAIDDISDVPVFEIDITDKEKVNAVMQELKPHTVYHLAAIHYIPECNENPERTLRINVEGTESLLNAAAAAGVAKFLFASSGAVYADSADPLSESAAIAPVDIYGWSKLFGEQLCQMSHRMHGTAIVICRLFNNYGPRETNRHIIPEILIQLQQGNELKLGNISPIRDYIHTSDCATALIKLAAACTDGVSTVNVAHGHGFTVAEMIEKIKQLTCRTIHVQLDTNRLRKNDKQTQVADVSLLKKTTGWQPETPIEEGLRRLLVFEQLLPALTPA
jgi:UDP-glucose 4-epimerase